MELPVYMYAWLAGRPNCHPVHTLKHIGMVEDLDRNHATMLCWSMMGSGAISIPFLEQQIYGELPPQLRFHGYLNDYEFNQECLKRGITPYAVIYEAQGWEFPIELNDRTTKIHRINLNIDCTKFNIKEYGLREFTNDKYPVFNRKKFHDYFPDGIINSQGKYVTDLYDECCCRDMYGNPTHSHWVEVEGLSQTCRGMCRNNPVWRTYLKKQIETVIDAGAVAVQLDETETPITSLGYGGCFCKDCMEQFRNFLKSEKNKGELPEEMQSIDLDSFDYRKFLRDNNYKWDDRKFELPYFNEYWKFQIYSQNKYFQELSSYVKEYGKKSNGIDVAVSANFSNMDLLFYPSLNSVDRCTTELRRAVFKRHNWLRLAAGYSKDKPLIIAESPYDEFIPHFVDLIHRGLADDYYRVFMMEPAIHGLSMAMPYGAWMGNSHFDSFYAPFKVGEEVQEFLFNNQNYFNKQSGAKVLVLYSYGAYMMRDYFSGAGEHLEWDDPDQLYSYRVTYDKRFEMPFFDVTQGLGDHQIPFDVLVTGDDCEVPDTFDIKDLVSYDMVVIPDDCKMTKNQMEVLREYSERGNIYISGRFSGPDEKQDEESLSIPAVYCEKSDEIIGKIAKDYERIRTWRACGEDIYVQENISDDELIFHIINYQMDAVHHFTIPQNIKLTISKKLVTGIREKSPMNQNNNNSLRVAIKRLNNQNMDYSVDENEESYILTIKNLPCYIMVLVS